ncbi:MAG: DUF402 domain-containing protein [Erysipelotrichaceae bacterium]|nr:DUF402 domain-containing protein [Erysipelotrichaceae bacterium]
MIPQQGTYVTIVAYKHDGHVRRSWDQGFVLESDDKHYVIITNKTWVQDDDGHKWYTREPALCYFYTDKWYNVIAMLRETGIYYYCNLASPALYDGEAVKYIDYDLDYKFFPDDSVLLLDEDEYASHSEQMSYPPEIDRILKKYMQEILEREKAHLEPFNREINEKQFHQYLDLMTAVLQ